jgi:hypothetical protein
MNSKMVYGFQHGPKGIAIYLWPLDLVKSNIPVLHSLSSEGWPEINKIGSGYDFLFKSLLAHCVLTKSKDHN